jgi:hypothetical protein
VNVCSLAGKLRILKSAALADRFRSAKTGDEVAALGREFVDAVASGRWVSSGPPSLFWTLFLLLTSVSLADPIRIAKAGDEIAALGRKFVNAVAVGLMAYEPDLMPLSILLITEQ